MNIAIIDDGVNTNYFDNVDNLIFDLYVNKKNKIVRRVRYDNSVNSHGTTCAAIIKKYSPSANIGSIKIISDETLRGNAKQLHVALEWCLYNNIKIVHMSIGSRQIQDAEHITKVIKKLMRNNIIVVAALANTMKYSLPACIKGVFGVKTSELLIDSEFQITQCGLLDVPFIASSQHILKDKKGVIYITPQCNSFAAPLITAKVFSIIEKNSDISQVELEKVFGLTQNICNYNIFQNTKFLLDNINIPVFFIDGTRKASTSIGDQLCKAFISKGYPCMIFDTWKFKAAVQSGDMPRQITLTQIIAFYIDRLDLSLVIIATDDKNSVSIESDATIKVLPKIKNNRYYGDIVWISEEANNKKLNNIVNYFTNYN